jgi:hypothetical protein
LAISGKPLGWRSGIICVAFVVQLFLIFTNWQGLPTLLVQSIFTAWNLLPFGLFWVLTQKHSRRFEVLVLGIPPLLLNFFFLYAYVTSRNSTAALVWLFAPVYEAIAVGVAKALLELLRILPRNTRSK